MKTNLSEQELIRRQKLDELRKIGIDPYPAQSFPVNIDTTTIKNTYNAEEGNLKEVCLAGRLMSVRIMGKAAFAELQDAKGKIQLYVSRDDISKNDSEAIMYNSVFKKLLDLGDYIGVKGYVFLTKVGEISVHVQELTLLSKSLKPLPVVKTDQEGHAFDEVTDPEFKYRQRYADMVVNPKVREVFIQRAKIINTIREFLNNLGLLEVDTPVLQNIPGGAAAKPFITHHNALDVPFYLRIANELYLKRCIVGGFEGVFEFSRNFRNEGMDRTHNPEFTVLEFYVAFKDYEWMMEVTEQLLEKIAITLFGKTTIQVGENVIDFKAPLKRITMYDAINEFTGIDISNMDENQLREVCHTLQIHTEKTMGRGKLIDEIFGAKCEANFIQPTFIIDYPVEMSPLTKKHRTKAGLVERFELMVNGKEIANAYSELNDPIDQRERFEEQTVLMNRGDEEAMFIDYDFLRAMEYGMPPMAGIGFGIDRLTMLFTNQASIQDVLLFPQMKPEK
jgi:lysyl-tRNA synthetase class 2